MATAKICDAPPDELGDASSARDLELRIAERDGAIRLVDRLVRCLEKQGGYLSHEEQFALHEGRELTEQYGLRRPAHTTPWLGK